MVFLHCLHIAATCHKTTRLFFFLNNCFCFYFHLPVYTFGLCILTRQHLCNCLKIFIDIFVIIIDQIRLETIETIEEKWDTFLLYSQQVSSCRPAQIYSITEIYLNTIIFLKCGIKLACLKKIPVRNVEHQVFLPFMLTLVKAFVLVLHAAGHSWLFCHRQPCLCTQLLPDCCTTQDSGQSFSFWESRAIESLNLV